MENGFKRQKKLKKANLKTTNIEYVRASATQLTPDKTPNKTSVFRVSIVEPEDREGLLVRGELADGDEHWWQPVARVHRQIPIFATTVVV